MGQAKLQKIGNSLGFRVSKSELEKAGFEENSEYEIVAEKGVILFVKKRPHHTKWVFKDTSLSKEDQKWLEAKLEDEG